MFNSSASQDASLNDMNVVRLEDGPADTVTSLVWAPFASTNIFACSSWDSKVRIYEAVPAANMIALRGCFEVQEPCLSTSWGDNMSKLFAGSIDNSVQVLDVMTGKAQHIGQHEAPVKDIYWLENINALCTLSFDRTLRLWDTRQQHDVLTFQLGSKVYCSDLLFPSLLLGLSDEKILKLDLMHIRENFNTLDCFFESPLGKGSQLTSISHFCDGTGFGVSSNDGRANLSKFNTGMDGQLSLTSVITFKCHKSDDKKILFPVHSIGFNPKSNKFVHTAGGEGALIFWDYHARSKTKTLNFNNVPVNKVKANLDGSLLAYALGYDWARGVEGVHSIAPRVCVHVMQQQELEIMP